VTESCLRHHWLPCALLVITYLLKRVTITWSLALSATFSCLCSIEILAPMKSLDSHFFPFAKKVMAMRMMVIDWSFYNQKIKKTVLKPKIKNKDSRFRDLDKPLISLYKKSPLK